MADNSEVITSVELAGGNRIALYHREGLTKEEFYPWLLVESESGVEASGLLSQALGVLHLEGEGELKVVVRFQRWSDFLWARDLLKENKIPFFAFNTPAKQYMTWTGRTLFRGMRYWDLQRLQLDIETLSLDPNDPEAGIILIAVSDTKGFEEVIDGRSLSEAEMIQKLSLIIQDRDPAVIEGHNIFEFDIPYLVTRARKNGVSLSWGRDGSEVKTSGGVRRFKVGARAPSYHPAFVHGRHIIDTYQQVQRFDVAGDLESYGLKEVVRQLGLERKGRVFVGRDDIPELWRSDPEKLIGYALDDVRDVRALSELVVPVEFYQAQLVPDSFQSSALTGPGEKINSLMVRAYLRRRKAIPKPKFPKDYPGGYTELKASGSFKKVVKADAQSLYPSIMLTCRIKPSSDTEGVFLPMLEKLTQRRLEAKSKLKISSGQEKVYWDGIQASLKVLINSFYGYLGYAMANFNDFEAAARVTETGQRIAKETVRLLESKGAKVIEVDTDGVYFVVPDGVEDFEDEERLIEEISEELPEGINLSRDGSYLGMLSLKAKNYALLGYDGTLTIRGSSLRSRRDERFLREFIQKSLRLLAEGKPKQVSREHMKTAKRIEEGKIPVVDFCRWETITEKTFKSPNLRRLAQAAEGKKVGDKVAVYQRKDGSLGLLEDYKDDEDKGYLLRRLYDAAGRFKELFEEAEFKQMFPLIMESDKDAQLSLF